MQINNLQNSIVKWASVILAVAFLIFIFSSLITIILVILGIVIFFALLRSLFGGSKGKSFVKYSVNISNSKGSKTYSNVLAKTGCQGTRPVMIEKNGNYKKTVEVCSSNLIQCSNCGTIGCNEEDCTNVAFENGHCLSCKKLIT